MRKNLHVVDVAFFIAEIQYCVFFFLLLFATTSLLSVVLYCLMCSCSFFFASGSGNRVTDGGGGRGVSDCMQRGTPMWQKGNGSRNPRVSGFLKIFKCFGPLGFLFIWV